MDGALRLADRLDPAVTVLASGMNREAYRGQPKPKPSEPNIWRPSPVFSMALTRIPFPKLAVKVDSGARSQ